MKRSVLSGIIGLAVVSVLTASGQGGINFANFDVATQTYSPITWMPRPGPEVGVRSTDPVTVTLWYGLQGQPMVAGNTVTWNSGYESGGYYGYFTVGATLNGWSAGQTWAFQLRATGPFSLTGQSAIWTENADIANVAFTPPNPPPLPGSSHNFNLGFTVYFADLPEPSTAALGLCGLAGLWFSRRSRVLKSDS